jgi:predicted Zn-ribbon and HTH transcriptional regulator
MDTKIKYSKEYIKAYTDGYDDCSNNQPRKVCECKPEWIEHIYDNDSHPYGGVVDFYRCKKCMKVFDEIKPGEYVEKSYTIDQPKFKIKWLPYLSTANEIIEKEKNTVLYAGLARDIPNGLSRKYKIDKLFSTYCIIEEY